jgi:hypothetical protein
MVLYGLILGAYLDFLKSFHFLFSV